MRPVIVGVSLRTIKISQRHLKTHLDIVISKHRVYWAKVRRSNFLVPSPLVSPVTSLEQFSFCKMRGYDSLYDP